MDINKRLHKRLNEYFKDNIKLFFIAEENIVIATKEDKVYIIDEYMNKTYGSIIYTNDESVVKELINESMVEELYNKDVVDIKSGVVHTIARTSDGKIYVWGYCDYGVLGFGFNDKKIYRPKLSENLTDLNIIDMSCGAYRTLVLTSSGDIYSWGWNQFGQTANESDSEYQLIPMKINGMKSEKFKAISCGFWNSMALTEDGRVFSCGQNTYGQLGDLSFKDSNKLKPVDMKNVIVEKISCGLCHSVFLSNKGDVYVSGPYYNEHMDVNRAIPRKLNHLNKFSDIATHRHQNCFVALSQDGIYYVWGEIELMDEIQYEPKKTCLKSFNEIFINFWKINYKPIEGMIIQFEDSFVRKGNYKYFYREVKRLGAGSFGEVFKTKFETSDNFNAVKKIIFKNENEKEILKELEIYCLISKIKHENVLSYESFWIEKNFIQKCSTLYIDMELCEQTLSEFLDTIEKLDFGETKFLALLKYYISSEIFNDILEGVNYLHKQNPPIIHRDLCPDNILIKLKENNEVVLKIADFGLVTIHKYAEQLHEPALAHVRYVAPEVDDGGEYDSKAHIYSIGMILRDLFDIGFGDDHHFTNTSILRSKYVVIIDLYKRMASKLLNERPNCEQILEMRNDWALNAKDFLTYDPIAELRNITKSFDQQLVIKFIDKKFIQMLTDSLKTA